MKDSMKTLEAGVAELQIRHDGKHPYALVDDFVRMALVTSRSQLARTGFALRSSARFLTGYHRLSLELGRRTF